MPTGKRFVELFKNTNIFNLCGTTPIKFNSNPLQNLINLIIHALTKNLVYIHQ